MSRTPFHALLARAARTARLADSLGAPGDEVAEALREAQRRMRADGRIDHSRRRFLAATGAAVGVAALDACAPPGAGRGTAPTPRTPTREAEVLVVGGGIAGLTTAWRLREGGVRVRVADAQTRVGGRMYSLRGHFGDGQVAELGGELIDTNHVHIRALARELAIDVDDLATDDAQLSRDVWHFGGAARSDADVIGAYAPIGRLVARDLGDVDLDAVTHRGASPEALALDRLSLAEWMDRAGVSGWMRDLLTVAYVTEMGLEPDRQSALNFLTYIDPSPDPFRIFGESDERFHVRGGNDRIVQSLAARLGESTFDLGERLVAVEARAGGGWRCTFDRDGRTRTTEATHVVLALPFTLLREVRVDAPLSPAKRRAIAELGYGTNAKLMTGFAERVWRLRHRSNGSVLTDRPFQLSWETSRLQEGAHGLLTNFVGGAAGVALGAGTPADQAARFTEGLEGVFAGVGSARAGMREARFHWPSHPWTRGSYASYLPGQWTSLRGAEREAVGTLHFAGEHTSLAAQGYMEGGCESGERAAREVLATLGAAPPRAPWLDAERGRRTARRRAVREAFTALLG